MQRGKSHQAGGGTGGYSQGGTGNRRREGKGGAGGSYNSNSREANRGRFIDKILVNTALFPPHLKAAAILIGVKGCNHARMQDESGCCVQLRGAGLSAPGTPGSDEPLHLWIRHDGLEQLATVRAVFDDIVLQCQRMHNYTPPPHLVNSSQPSAYAPQTGGAQGGAQGQSLGFPTHPQSCAGSSGSYKEAPPYHAGDPNDMGGEREDGGRNTGRQHEGEMGSEGGNGGGLGVGNGDMNYNSSPRMRAQDPPSGSASPHQHAAITHQIHAPNTPPLDPSSRPHGGPPNNNNSNTVLNGPPPGGVGAGGDANIASAKGLPPKFDRPPVSPLECFFTVHYLIHARPNVLVSQLVSVYQEFYGFSLDPRLSQLGGGDLVRSLTLLPQILALIPQPGEKAANENGGAETISDYIIKPVLPADLPYQTFHTLVNKAPAAPPPPPPQPTPHMPTQAHVSPELGPQLSPHLSPQNQNQNQSQNAPQMPPAGVPNNAPGTIAGGPHPGPQMPGHGPRGYPGQLGHEHQQMQVNGISPQVALNQGLPPHGLPPQGVPPQGVPPQGLPPQGLPPQGLPPHGVPPQSLPPQGVPPQGLPPHGLAQGISQGMPQGRPHDLSRGQNGNGFAPLMASQQAAAQRGGHGASLPLPPPGPPRLGLPGGGTPMSSLPHIPPANPTLVHVSQPLSPANLMIQGMHWVLLEAAQEDLNLASHPQQQQLFLLNSWPGRPLSSLKASFQSLTGIKTEGALFGFPSFEEFLYRAASPQIFELRQYPDSLYLKFGIAPFRPNFSGVDINLKPHQDPVELGEKINGV